MESTLSLADIMPKAQRSYDKNRAPKLLGQPTVAYFHVTGTPNFPIIFDFVCEFSYRFFFSFVCGWCDLVLSLDSVNEESMTYVTDIFLAQSWRDPRLRLPSNMHEEYRILDVDWLHDIWRPDSFFKNAKKVTFHEMSIPNHYLWLYRDKTLLYMAKYEQYHLHSSTSHSTLFVHNSIHSSYPTILSIIHFFYSSHFHIKHIQK